MRPSYRWSDPPENSEERNIHQARGIERCLRERLRVRQAPQEDGYNRQPYQQAKSPETFQKVLLNYRSHRIASWNAIGAWFTWPWFAWPLVCLAPGLTNQILPDSRAALSAFSWSPGRQADFWFRPDRSGRLLPNAISAAAFHFASPSACTTWSSTLAGCPSSFHTTPKLPR